MSCVELLILLCIAAALLVLLGRYPDLGKPLFWLLRNRRSAWATVWFLALGLAGLAWFGIFAEVLHKPGPAGEHLFLLALCFAVALPLGWAMLHFFRLMIADERPTDRPAIGPRDLPAESPLVVFRKFIQLMGRLAARASRLSFKDLLLASFLVVSLGMLAILTDKHQHLRGEDVFMVPLVLLFWWAICFLAFWLIVWLLQKIFRGVCPSIEHLKDLLAERLPAEERTRLAAHLELCHVCQHRVEGLMAGHYPGPGLAQKFKDRMAESGPALRKIMDKLKGHIAVRRSRFSIKSLLRRFLVWVGTMVYPSRLLVWPFRKLSPGACPPMDYLKDLLAERLPAEERVRLAAHLELCPICQHRVEGLTAAQNSWPGLARKLSNRPAEPEPALRKVMAQLKEGNEEETRDEPAFAADLPLGFLSPSDKPEHLGRLERYEVLQEIGRGGMGIVLKAFDPSLHRVVAIKVLAPQLATSGVARKRFLREAKAAAAVTHDHIVTIHAVDEANGLPYLVMQYVPGQSLQDRIDKDGPLELTDILRIGMQTASALAAAHAHGIVHRDIKPANILLEEGVQRVKITDFGLARAMDDASLTQSGFVAGSPLYMAPEQARGEALDHRADLFSLGSVMYTMCTGRPPFRAANTLAVLRRVSEDPPRPIRETNPEIPDWLAEVVGKLMAKEPSERFQSAAEVEEGLGRNLAQLQHASWVPPPRPPVPPGGIGFPPSADLPTSVTICPSCGASLHVPERMVGGIVHCFECGKPFHVEAGSEVIQVAQPAGWPMQRRFCRRRRVRGCLLIAVTFIGLPVLMTVFYLSVSRPAVTMPATRVVRPPLPKAPPKAHPPPRPPK